MTPLAHGLFGILALAAAGCQATSGHAPDVLISGARVTVGKGPSAVAVGDLTADGHPDLLVANALSHDLTLLQGDGTGQFTKVGDFPAGENPVDVALGDFDEDGDLDAAVANHDTHYVTLLLNDGAGGLRPAKNSPLSLDVRPHPHALRATDLDRDGHIDLLVDDRQGEGVVLLRGLGNAQFDLPGTRISVGGDPYRGMAVGDLDGDGWADLVTPNRGEIAVVLRQPEGAFGDPRGIAAARPFAVEIADLNGDRVFDLVFATEPGAVRILLGEGGKRFRGDSRFEWQMPEGAKGIAVGDFNADGFADAAITNFQSPGVLLLLGGSEGIRTSEVDGGENPWGLAVSDLNEDGRDDLVVLDYTGQEARVYVAAPR